MVIEPKENGTEIVKTFLKNSDNSRLFNKLMSVCPTIDNEFRHNIVKVNADPGGE